MILYFLPYRKSHSTRQLPVVHETVGEHHLDIFSAQALISYDRRSECSDVNLRLEILTALLCVRRSAASSSEAWTLTAHLMQVN
jgi:hypothetical protein